mmetsp:Transcript_3500/g.7188  ORF Transcript_3500/g.7188 Transcript_3500/m.7188 type:complete len:106 (+) Transcript_3500:120-437(+)
MEEKVPSSAGAGSLVMNTKEEHEIVAGDINAGQEQEKALFPETTTTASTEPIEPRPNPKRSYHNPRGCGDVKTSLLLLFLLQATARMMTKMTKDTLVKIAERTMN